MYSRPARGKVPEYPRHIPTIDLDDIPVCEDTIVYEHWADDTDGEADERAKKRQKRRQEAAEIYLRGGEVRLLTASLRGPFQGWRNPWAKKRQKRDAKARVEVPETTVRNIRSPRTQAGGNNAAKGSQRDPIDLADDDDIPLYTSTTRAEPPNPFSARSRADPVPLAGPAPSSTKRVEDWLKTSDVYARRPRSPAGSSPTPAARPPTRVRVSPEPRSSPPQAKRRGQESAAEPEASEQQVVQDAPASRPGTSSSVPTHESPQRAEAAILQQKRKSLQVVPPSTNLPAFEYWRPRRAAKKNVANHQLPDDSTSGGLRKSTSVIDAPLTYTEAAPRPPVDQSEAADHSTSKPALSTETSKRSTLHNVPSAQVAPAPNRPRPISNNQSTNDLLQELPSAKRSELQTEKISKTSGDTASGAGAVENEAVTHQNGNAGPEKVAIAAGEGAAAPPPNDGTPVRELETQEMIAAIKPFDFSTIKKPISAFTGLRSPVTATKAQSTRTTKRASFAGEHTLSDDSQKSIKAAMKVKKITAAAPSKKPHAKGPLSEESAPSAAPVLEDVNKDLFDESLPSISSMFGPKKVGGPKSILKSSNAISSAPILSGNTTSASMRQEAQIPSGQPGQKVLEVDLVHEDDSFDLNAAIDDLGSYLGTWDADEEATKLIA